jgi:hypothetical protein
MFGIGGGFLMTPVLVFLGIPPAVAVASMSNHVAASSMSSVISYGRKRAVDFRMGGVLAAGGAAGSIAGVELFRWLRLLGQADLVVALSYLVFLGVIGGLMFWESVGAILRRRSNTPAPPRRDRRPPWLYGLPLKLRFPRSRLYISVIPPLLLGAFVGVLSAIMGVGGGFVLVPAMIYLLGMPTTVVIGTSNFQILFVAANVTFLQAASNGTVDIVLALLLIVGGVVGAPIGSRIAARLPGVVLRGLMAVLVLAVAAELLTELLRTPSSQYSISGRETSL